MNIAEKLTNIAENEEKVYEAGKKAEYDVFWDAYQQSGKRINYDFAFAGDGWNDNTFKPKYDIIPNWNIVNLFYKTAITDLDALLKRCGVALDIRDNGNYSQVFASSAVTVLPELVISRNASTTYETFAGCTSLHTIRKLTFEKGMNAGVNHTSLFNNCSSLANIEFDGELVGNISLQASPLTRASIESLFSILSDSASGKTATLKASAKEAAFTDSEWSELCATKTNWNIELI